MTKTYSNPRLEAVISDWPSGSRRVEARFAIEARAGKGERATRTTTGAPKVTTFALKTRIVTGDDGRTYIANLTMFGHISIMRGDMQFSEEAIFPHDPRYPEVAALFA